MGTRSTTTIRVAIGTRELLTELAAARGTSIQEAARDAAEALRRQEFARAVRSRLDDMRADSELWADYLTEGAATEVDDGIDP